MKPKMIIAALLVSFWVGLNQIQGKIITIEITGEVTSLGGYTQSIPDTIYPGVTFSGTYTYDSSTINTSSLGGIGQYVHNSPYGMEILIGGLSFKTVSNHVGQYEVDIVNSISNWDYYKITSKSNEPIDGITVSDVSWTLGGPGDTISSIALPVSAPELADWSTNVLEISGFDALNHELLIQGIVTKAVPEPATSFLLLSAVGFLFKRR